MPEIKEYYTIVCKNHYRFKECGWKNKWRFTDLHPTIQEMLVNNDDADAHVHTTCARCKQDIHFSVKELLNQ
jgi:hypothetical protein